MDTEILVGSQFDDGRRLVGQVVRDGFDVSVAFWVKDGVAVVKQTVKRKVGQSERYVSDGQRERHVDPGDDAALGAAVRGALKGRL